ncbi:MAG: hypothetical protein MK289_17250 [Trichodesmium sp. ALOHA_ZT_67]|uniref:hypothetical protein n=1 Tax=Trichodesmium erythraeum TaxID=1206 RepID=UPI00003C9A3E|nr:hypothetical protein [Trichodesmium erythraeum GBRTRLIN201]MCH2050164.1 hypothetical protein [Trichodesmium sp. ALOHA_ZT_67]MDE5094694.1 hypothetical protein [Trichodesmium sp. St11_bin5]MDT9339557.1 hypothetical protein [Trichodesmium erythraeum 21-75]
MKPNTNNCLLAYYDENKARVSIQSTGVLLSLTSASRAVGENVTPQTALALELHGFF